MLLVCLFAIVCVCVCVCYRCALDLTSRSVCVCMPSWGQPLSSHVWLQGASLPLDGANASAIAVLAGPHTSSLASATRIAVDETDLALAIAITRVAWTPEALYSKVLLPLLWHTRVDGAHNCLLRIFLVPLRGVRFSALGN